MEGDDNDDTRGHDMEPLVNIGGIYVQSTRILTDYRVQSESQRVEHEKSITLRLRTVVLLLVANSTAHGV